MAAPVSSRKIIDYVSTQLLGARASYRIASKSWTLDGTPVSQPQIVKMIAGLLDVSGSRVTNALECLTFDLAREKREEVKRWVYRNNEMPRCDAELKRYLRLMERPETPIERQKANELALKQWLWQIKRGATDQSLRWHVALIFWSRENGTGKSYNVQRILQPISNYTRHCNVDELGERFSGGMFANTLVAFFDEFAGAENACSNNLKSILTGRPWDQRAMYADTGFYAENRTSAIATSNMDPPHGYVDTTGARRFWSIHCDGTSMEQNPDRMASFDSLDVDRIFAAVSSQDPSPHESASKPLLSFMDKVREHSLRSKTSLEAFIEDQMEACEPDFKLPLKELQIAYGRYCMETKQKVLKGGYRILSDQLKNLGLIVVNHGSRYYLKGRCLSTTESL